MVLALGVRGADECGWVMATLYHGWSDMDHSPTAIIVLGLLEFGEATPYELKVRVAGSVGNFWSVPHSALYAEPERLAKAGLAEERREQGGRRRRVFSITDAGRRALDEWRAEPTSDPAELRDPALLKLFFGADPAQMAAAQLPLHRERLARYEDDQRPRRRQRAARAVPRARGGHPPRARVDRVLGGARVAERALATPHAERAARPAVVARPPRAAPRARSRATPARPSPPPTPPPARRARGSFLPQRSARQRAPTAVPPASARSGDRPTPADRARPAPPARPP